MKKAKDEHYESESESRGVAVMETHSSDTERDGRPPADELSGRGLLVPAQATGIEYPVTYGLKSQPAGPQYGRVLKPTRWAKCLIRTARKRVFPDGHYFLHTAEGRVHQLKVIGGVWHCLAVAM
jgi:hypothetical protein